MNKLYDFLNPITTIEEKEVIVSKRFIRRNDKGEPLLDTNGETILAPFKIRAISQEENDALVRAATNIYKDRTGARVKDLNRQKYIRSLIVAATVEPDFRDSELCAGYGTLDPEEVPGKMLLAGEFQRLADEISNLSGFEDDSAEEEAKN